MTTEPTAGAMAAANEVYDVWIDILNIKEIEHSGWLLEPIKTAMASIIDRETGLPKKRRALRIIANLHGNMSLDSIEQVNGINDGRDRAIKLRVAIETARDAFAKHEGKR